jgi:hypothetical protein
MRGMEVEDAAAAVVMFSGSLNVTNASYAPLM